MLSRNIFSRSRISRIIIYAIVTTTILFLSAAGSNVAVISFSDQGSRTATTPVTCTPPPSGTVSWWPGDGHSRDTRSTNHGTLINGANHASGEVASAFNFNGINQYLSIPQAAVLPVRGTNAFTIEAWINHQGDAANEMFNVFAYRNGGQDVQFFVTRTQIGIWGTSSAGMIILTNHGVNAATWNHYAFTRSGSTWRVFVNGNQVGADATNAVNLLTPTTPQNIGTTGLANTQFAKGMIDEIGIYDRALLQTEIEAINTAGTAGKCRTATSAPVGLVSWWSGDGNSLDSRSRNHGVLQNGGGYDSGFNNQAFNFNGANQHVEIADASNLRPTLGLTIDGWFKFNTTSPQAALISKPFVTGSSNAFALWIQGGSLWGSSGGGFLSIPFAPNTGRWYHMAYTYDDATFLHNLWLDGEIVATKTQDVTLTYDSASVLIGLDKDNNSPVLPLNGMADEVSIYNRALSTREIQSIVNAGNVGKITPTAVVPPSGLVGWWGGDGDARDYSANSNNGTLLPNGAYSVGKTGQTFAFNGTLNSGVTIPHNSNYDLGPSGFTAEFWVKSNGIQPELRSGLLEKSHGYVDSTGWAFHTFSDQNNLHFAIGVGGAGNGNFSEVISTGANMLDGNYHHVAGTWEANTMSLYIDGALQYSIPNVIPANNVRDLNIGYTWGGGTPQRAFNGSIDEVTLYNRALSASEIQSIVNAGLAGKLRSVATPANLFAEARGKTSRNEAGVAGIRLGDATVTLPTISAGGVTQQIPLDLTKLPPLPMGATPTNLAYDIATSATWSGTPAVCFNVPALSQVYPNLRILHLENGVWVNRTQVPGSTPILCSYGLTSLSPFAIVDFGPTAASVSVSGRVMTAYGNGVRNAIVQLTDQDGVIRTARTGSFGYYRFEDVRVGETYMIGVASKRFVFTPRTIAVSDDVTDLDLVAQDQ